MAALGAPVPKEAKPGARTELHVVCVHEGSPAPGGRAAGAEAAVLVDRPDVEVTLVLSAYNPVAWQVTATPRTKVKKVILAGYHRQTATVPDGAELVQLYYEGREGKSYLYFYYKLDSPRLRPAVQAIHQLTGQEIKSFRGTYRFSPTDPLTVDSVQNDPRLASDFPKPMPAAELPKVKFEATHQVATSRFDVTGSFGNFTQNGPDRDSLKPLPRDIRRLAFDPKRKKHYGLTAHQVHEVDLDKKKSTKMDLGSDVPELSWPRAIAFDTKQDRLLVVASKSIYAYSPANGKWAVLAELPRGTEVAALGYHSKDDTVYGLGQELFGEERSTRPILFHFNAQGAIVKATELPAPMFPGLLGRGPESRAQLVGAGDYLAVVIGGAAPRNEDGRTSKAESFLFLVDPKTDKVKLAWKE
jgi:hypothetical protein